MFEVKSNQEIGKYLDFLIKKKYNSVRQFGKKCLLFQNKKESVSEDSVNNMANRLSQIINGNKGIQLTDLSVFCFLLNVTCESILSAGSFQTESSTRMTNYKLSFIKDKKVWEEYIHRDDKLILNTDEYDKTLIDYAFEHKNYPLLQYLVNHDYIWFINDDTQDGFYKFSAGTNIERRKRSYDDDLQSELLSKKELRSKMITLAMENQDFDMLKKMRAREVPQFYDTLGWSCQKTDYSPYYDENFIRLLASADYSVLDYFTEEFEIENERTKETFTFIYPFLGELLSELNKIDSKALPTVLKRAIQHNHKALEQLKKVIQDCIRFYKSCDNGFYWQVNQDKEILIKNDVRLNQDGTILSCILRCEKGHRFVTNIIKADFQSKDFVIQDLVDELNKIYSQMQDIQPLINEYLKKAD